MLMENRILDRYWKFNNKEPVPGYPKDIGDNFEGVPNNVDAAFVWSGNGKMYFFKNNQYWKFDPSRKPPVRDVYPRFVLVPLCQQNETKISAPKPQTREQLGLAQRRQGRRQMEERLHVLLHALGRVLPLQRPKVHYRQRQPQVPQADRAMVVRVRTVLNIIFEIIMSDFAAF